MDNTNLPNETVLKSVIHWFENAVLGLNLCPFAARPYQSGSIVFAISNAADDEGVLSDLYLKLQELDESREVETLVLICSQHLAEFEDYNQFLSLSDALLEQSGWLGEYQIASFHPDYCFEGCEVDSRENWTNRSPYPILHLIRESSISSAIQHHADVDQIPQQNIKTMNNLSESQMQKIFRDRFEKKITK